MKKALLALHNGRNKQTLGIFIAVLLAHVGLFFLIQVSFQARHKATETVVSDVQPINATLVFFEAPPKETEQSEQTPAEAEQELTEDIELVETEPATTQPEIAEVERPEASIEPSDTAQKPALPENANVVVADDTSPARATIDINALTSNALSSIQSNALNEVALEEVRARQAAKNTIRRPIIEESNLTEEEKLIESITVNVDCSSTAGKWASILSGFTGGTFRCSPNPEINSFIQKRLPGGRDPKPEDGEKD